jgi:hypothetical protein
MMEWDKSSPEVERESSTDLLKERLQSGFFFFFFFEWSSPRNSKVESRSGH